MKSLGFSSKKVQNIWLIVIGLFVVTIGLIISCGKLTENSAPTSPVGTSGGSALPTGLESSRGTYTLSLSVTPTNTVPADSVSYLTLHAKLVDTSGRTVENFTIEFEAELGYLENDPVGPIGWSNTATGRTSQWGTVSMYYYGARMGSDQVQARIDLDRDGLFDLYTTVLIIVTEGAGVPGPKVPGIYLTVSPTGKLVELGDCAKPSSQEVTFNFTAIVWDKTGSRAGSGVRVEVISSNPDNNGHYTTDSTGQATWTVIHTVFSPGTYTFTLTAEVIIDGVSYRDTVSYTIVARCTTAAATPTPGPQTVTLTANAIPTTTIETTANISVYALAGTQVVPNDTQIRFSVSAIGASFVPPNSPGYPPGIMVTTGGVASATLNYPLAPAAPRPATITVYFTVVDPGYSGSGSVTVTFN